MTIHLHQPHRVYLKQRWDDDWDLAAGTYCDQCSFACAPDVGQAVIGRTFGGQVLTAGTQTFANRDPLTIEGWYVKVEIAQDALGLFTSTKVWLGLVVESIEDRTGIQNLTDEIGRQVWQCRGLEWLLQRTLVDSARVFNNDDEEITIGRGLAFNLGGGTAHEQTRQGNRSLDLGENGSHLFSKNLSDADAVEWSARDAVQYLLANHGPVDADGVAHVNIALSPEASSDILDRFFPLVETHGKTVWELLNELIDRRRGMTWWIDVSGVQPVVAVASFNSEVLTLPSGATIPPNPSQLPWYSDDDQIIRSFKVLTDDAVRFDQVLARGERRGACFTLSYPDSLHKDWDDALQTAYNAGASGAADYAAKDDFGKQDANQAFRQAHRFRKVYRYFRVPPEWNGRIAGKSVCQDLDDADGLDENADEIVMPFWMPGLRFLSRLPLLTERDYTTVASVTSEELEASKPEYLRPFAVLAHQSRYYPLDKLAHGAEWDGDPESGGWYFSCSLRMQDDALGVVIDVTGSAAQHAIADGEFTPADQYDEADYAAIVSWHDFFVTVFCEWDAYTEAQYPPAAEIAATDAVRRLEIRVPGARLDYLVPNTIVDIKADGTRKLTSGGYVVDDREKLQDVARSAWQWYGQVRRAIEGVQHHLAIQFDLGDLITEYGDPNVALDANTVVTSLTYDLLAGTVTVRTAFANLDLTAF